MLILSRKQSEAIVFPSLNIRIEILKASGNQVRVGIDAPREIAVLRAELQSDGQSSSPNAKPVAGLTEAVRIVRELEQLASMDTKNHVGVRVDELLRRLQSIEQLRDQQNVGQPLRSKRALVVDDNDNETKLLASYLRLKGFAVDIAQDGRDAMMQLTEGKRPDVVLLDMNMPKFDGRWTIGQIRRSHRFGDAKVYAISGTDQVNSGVEIGPRGVDHWFTKPLNPERLVDSINAEFEPILN